MAVNTGRDFELRAVNWSICWFNSLIFNSLRRPTWVLRLVTNRCLVFS